MPWDKVMDKFGAGSLKSNGKRVTDPKQAVAIKYSEKRKAKFKPEYRKTGGMGVK